MYFSESEPLLIGIQDGYPSCSFQYTCMRWIETKSVYLTVGVNSLFLAGTTSGGIVLFGCNDNEIWPLSLLGGHTTKVTDIQLGSSSDQFFTVSDDGTMIVWSLLDFTCIERYTNVSIPGEIYLRTCTWNSNWIFAFTLGHSISIYNISEKRIISRLLKPGLMGFNPVILNRFITNDVHLFERWKLDQSLNWVNRSRKETQSLSRGVQTKATPFGFIGFSQYSFHVYGSTSNIVYLDLRDGDTIGDIDWNEEGFFGVITNMGDVFEYQIGRGLDNVRLVSKFENPFEGCYSTMAYRHNNGFAFATTDHRVYVVRNGTILQFNPTKSTDLICSRGTIRLARIDERSCKDLTSGKVYSHTTSKITALCIDISEKGQTHIICGGEDGSIVVHQDGLEARQVPCITGPVEFIVSIPGKGHSTYHHLIIGSDGSCAIDFLTVKVHPLATQMVPISAVYLAESSATIVIETIDRLFTTYSIETGDLLECNSVLSLDAVPIWRRTWARDRRKLSTARIGSCYVKYRVWKVGSFLADSDSGDAKLIHSVTSDSGADKTDSIVLFGRHSIPTFSYEKGRLVGDLLSLVSPYVSGLQLVISQIMNTKMHSSVDVVRKLKNRLEQHETNFQLADCLPVLLRMFHINNTGLQILCADLCTQIVDNVPIEWVQQKVSMFASSTTITANEMIILSLAVVIDEKVVPEDHLQVLYDFLLTASKGNLSEKLISSFVLARGLSVWTHYGSLYEILVTVIDVLLSNNSIARMYNAFRGISIANIDAVLHIVRERITEAITRNDEQLLARTMDLTTSIAQYGATTVATLMLINLLHETYDAVYQLVLMRIHVHCHLFKNVTMYNETVLIGTESGSLVIQNINKGHHKIEKKVFKEPVGFISVNPTGTCAFMCSSKTMQYVLVEMTRSNSIFKREVTLKVHQNKQPLAVDSTENIVIRWGEGMEYQITTNDGGNSP